MPTDAPLPAAGGYPPYRRRGRRWWLLGIGVVIVGVGLVFIGISAEPKAFGLSPSFGFPYGGGFFGIFLVLWGAMMMVRFALWSGRRGGAGGPPGRRFDPAILEARRRYARGEITREQFEQLVSDLRRPPGPLP